MKNAAKGKGYTIRVGGKKCLATSILEEQIEAAQRQFEELQQRNALLRAKEAMQLEALEGWEALLQQVAAVHDNATINEEHAARLVSAAMLDMQALSLKQELRPTQANTQGSTASAPPALGSSLHTSHRSSATAGELMAASAPAHISGSGNSSSAAAGSSSSSGTSGSSSSFSSGSLSVDSNTRMAAVMAIVDVADIPELKQLTVQEIAGRVRCAVDKVRAAQQQAEDPMSDAAVVAAMREYAKLCIGHYMANDVVHMQLHAINIETMEPEFPSDEHVENIVRAVQLQPQQQQQISVGFHTNRKSEAKLMKKQQKLQQQLQALLTPADPPTDAGSSRAQPMDSSSSHHHQQQQQQQQPEGLPQGAEASTPGPAGHSVRDKAGALLAVVSGGQQGLSTGDLAWLTKAGVDVGGNPQQTKEMAAAGCLSVHAASNAEALLEQLSKLVHAQKQQLRALTMMWVNLLSPEQQAAAVVAGYPYMLHHPRLCAKVASLESEATQQ